MNILATAIFFVVISHCSGEHEVYVLPSSICGSAAVNVPVCSAVSALRSCSNVSSLIGASDIRGDEANISDIHLVLMSRSVVQTLAEHVFLSTTVIARAISELAEQLEWSRVTIVADIADAYFLRTAEELHKIATANSSDFSLLQLGDSDAEIEDMLDAIGGLKLRIIVLSLRQSIALRMLCRAHERQLVWPEYAWIVHSVNVSEESCGGSSTLDGVITLQLKDTMPNYYSEIFLHDYSPGNIRHYYSLPYFMLYS